MKNFLIGVWCFTYTKPHRVVRAIVIIETMIMLLLNTSLYIEIPHLILSVIAIMLTYVVEKK